MGAAVLSSLLFGHFYLAVLAIQDFYTLAGFKLCARRCHRRYFCSNIQLSSGLLRCEQTIVTDNGSNSSRLKFLHASWKYVPSEQCERSKPSSTERDQKPATFSGAVPSDTVRPDVSKPLIFHPNETRQGRRRTHSTTRNAVRTKETKQDSVLFDVTKSDTIHPDMTRSVIRHPDTTTPDSNDRKPDATKQETIVSEPTIDTIHLLATRPPIVRPYVTKSTTVQLDGTRPNTVQLDATTPNTIQLDATTSNSVHPDVTRRVTILTDRGKQDTGYLDASSSHTISSHQTSSETIHTDETRLNNIHRESTESDNVHTDTTRLSTIRISTIQPDPIYSNKTILKSLNSGSITPKRLHPTKTTLNPPKNTPQIVETTMKPFHSDAKNVTEQPTCADGVCRCGVGMSYDPKWNKCVKVCQKYGKTMSIYRGHFINDHNDYAKTWKGISLRGCIHKCVSLKEFLCKSFDYGTAFGFSLPFMKNECYLSKVGYFDVPSKMRKTLKIYTLGVRNCEP